MHKKICVKYFWLSQLYLHYLQAWKSIASIFSYCNLNARGTTIFLGRLFFHVFHFFNIVSGSC